MNANHWGSRAVLTGTFTATGVGMALPGALLPALLRQWSMQDGRAGFLFFLMWAGSAAGALLVLGSRARSLALGCLGIGVGAATMALASGWPAFAGMALYGVGLGMAMTSISLLETSRNADRRGRVLNRLNLFWALGATAGPVLSAHALRVANANSVFLAVAGGFLAAAVWVAVRERDTGRRTEGAQRGPFSLSSWPVVLVLLIPMPGAVESSMGGWITTYMHRASGGLAATVSAGTCFWIGLLVSRAVSSTPLMGRIAERTYLVGSTLLVAAGALLLLAMPGEGGILAAAFLVGFGLGPVYPLLLALALPYSENPLIFAMAGLGSAALPWITGVVSGTANSLRVGLIAPVTVAVVMALLTMAVPRPRAAQNT